MIDRYDRIAVVEMSVGEPRAGDQRMELLADESDIGHTLLTRYRAQRSEGE